MVADMLEGSYGKEPFDLRLTVLRMIRQWRRIAFITLAGTLLTGGIYCVKNILLRGERQYRAVSVYRMDYSVDDRDANLVLINTYTWNTYMHTEEFLGFVKKRLAGSGWEGLECEELGEYIQGDIESDWRVPSTIVTSENEGMATEIAKAVEEAVVIDFPEGISEVKSIRVIDHAGEAQEVIPDLRVGRAFILGAVLTFFFAVVILLLKELGDDNIWLPATLRRRYGLKTAGTEESGELKENICYLFRGTDRAAVCGVQEDCNPIETVELLKQICAGTTAESVEWFAAPSPLLCPETAAGLREADGILLAVKAGAHGGKQIEHVLDYLAQQDCKITAAILLGADETLIRMYYGFKTVESHEIEGKR